MSHPLVVNKYKTSIFDVDIMRPSKWSSSKIHQSLLNACEKQLGLIL